MRLAALAIAFLGLAAATANAVGAPAAPAAARPTSFDLLQDLCVAQHADPAKVLARADQDGWKPLTDDMLARLRAHSGYAQGRFRTTEGGGVLILAAAEGDPVADPQKQYRTCGVTAVPADAAAIDQAKAWAGFTGYNCSEFTCYTWREDGGKRIRLERAQVDALGAGDKTLTILMTVLKEKASVVLIVVPVQ